MSNAAGGWLDTFTTYKSVKFVRVKNRTLALTYYALMVLVLIYVIVFSLVMGKGYQKITYPVGTVSPKVKGTAVVPPESGELYEGTIWTADDMVIPAEANAAFITTKYLFTEQNRSTCTGNEDTKDCTTAQDCIANEVDAEYGIYTGNCLAGKCEVAGWCPLEDDKANTPLILDYVGNWTIFFKVNIRFPDFDIDKTNAEQRDGTAPVSGYNLFTLNEILDLADTSLSAVQEKGAIILFTTTFTCNLDKSKDDQCEPEYAASRIDNVEGSISPGFNYREVNYDTSYNERDLVKKWGVRVIYVIDGEGGKFDWIQTAITIGAGIGFFGIATLVTDFVMDCFVENAEKYAKAKYRDIGHDTESIPETPIGTPRTSNAQERPRDRLITGTNEISPI